MTMRKFIPIAIIAATALVACSGPKVETVDVEAKTAETFSKVATKVVPKGADLSALPAPCLCGVPISPSGIFKADHSLGHDRCNCCVRCR